MAFRSHAADPVLYEIWFQEYVCPTRVDHAFCDPLGSRDRHSDRAQHGPERNSAERIFS